jgi:hypothetical protein
MVCLVFGRKNPKEGIMQYYIAAVVVLMPIFVRVVRREMRMFRETQEAPNRMLLSHNERFQFSWDPQKGSMWVPRSVQPGQQRRAA